MCAYDVCRAVGCGTLNHVSIYSTQFCYQMSNFSDHFHNFFFVLKQFVDGNDFGHPKTISQAMFLLRKIITQLLSRITELRSACRPLRVNLHHFSLTHAFR